MEGLSRFFASLEFDAPFYIWIGATLLLLLVFLPQADKRRGLAFDSGYWNSKVALKSSGVWMLLIPLVITSALILGALPGPKETKETVTYIYGYPVMLVIDVSGSMGAGTSQVTGYQESLAVFNDLIGRRGDMNFGLILYSAENYVSRYFINKDELFRDTLENKDDIIEISNGTRPTDALAEARRFLTEKIKGDGKTIIFISDLHISGQEATNLKQEIIRVALSDINLYILATGNQKDRITEIPQAPGVKVIDMKDRAGIDLMCQEITSQQMSPLREDENTSETSLVPYLLLPALGLFVICLVLAETRFRRIP